MVTKIKEKKTDKEEMITYIQNRNNIKRIKTATEMKEFMQTSELQQIDDFQEFKSGCDSQLTEISRDDEQTTIEKKKQKRQERMENNSKQYTNKLKFSQQIANKYEIK